MLKEKSYKQLTVVLILLGSMLRITVFLVSPPNNSYDDHLEVINIYAQDLSRPSPFHCWECYQPPLYYYIAAVVYNSVDYLGGNKEICWKAVQGINPVLSIILLFLAYQILVLLKTKKRFIPLILSFLAILPRDIFTSAMIGNDYLVVFFAILTFYLFLKTLEEIKRGDLTWYWFGGVVLAAALGSLSKQQGLLLHLFPAAILLMIIKKGNRKMILWAILLLFFGTSISLSEELWKYNETGKILVSNQHYFDYAKNQHPGSLDKVEFFSFRLINLFQDPFISESTSASFFSELFARTFYDYEWRFISPQIPWANKLGKIGYSVGLGWIVFYLLILFSWVKQFLRGGLKANSVAIISIVTPILIALLFMTVPFLQTLRYPYFSSMKAMFMLSGIILFLLSIGCLINEKSFAQLLGSFMIAVNIFYGILLVISISLYIEISLNHLHGPIWSFPEI